jgi:membrane protein YqaA with SNARE-associated domain
VNAAFSFANVDPGWFSDVGLWGLFLASFLAATIVPFSSEAVLAAAALGPWSTGSLLITATVGNWLGGLTTYALGRLANAERISGWLRMDPSGAVKWELSIQRYGAWLALLCWAPFVGDVIALALGVFKVKPMPVAVLMLIGKAVRYAVVIAIMRGLFG